MQRLTTHVRRGYVAAIVAASFAGSVLAVGIASGDTPPSTVTLGSTSGTPSGDLCSGVDCTYVPFSGASSPELQVPFAGTVTSFSINAGSAGGTVELRVLRPVGGGQFTGAGTSPPQTLNVGVNTFTVSLPVEAGDVLGLDNATSALMFDTTPGTAITAYYYPSLADGATAAPNNNQTDYRLLLSATVQAAITTTTTTTTTTTSLPAPELTDASQSHRIWREGNALAKVSRARRPPLGTTFSFDLNEPAAVSFTFTRQLTGRHVAGRCVARTRANRLKRACKLRVRAGVLRFGGHAGTNKVRFLGRLSRSRKLPSGRYSVLITAINAIGQRTAAIALRFTIIKAV